MLPEDPVFTIVLPTHNQSRLLRFALESVCAQTFPRFEVFVVGDGCTDDTADVVADFTARDPRIHWRPFEKGFGFGYEHRNTVLREGRAPLIAYMAHDDLWLPHHLEKMRALFESHEDVDWAYSRPVYVERDGEVVPMAFNLFDPEILEGFLGKTNCSIYLCCVVHRRVCLEKYGWWNGAMERGGDLDLWGRIIEGGDRRNFEYLPEPTTLRFRAPYKADRKGNPWEMQIWQRLTKEYRVGVLPTQWAREYRLEIPEGIPEQEAIWTRIAAAPESWSRELRRQVALQLDHRVWRSNYTPYGRLSQLEYLEGSW